MMSSTINNVSAGNVQTQLRQYINFHRTLHTNVDETEIMSSCRGIEIFRSRSAAKISAPLDDYNDCQLCARILAIDGLGEAGNPLTNAIGGDQHFL